MTEDRWVCLDVGETLIDETRVWSMWADELRVPRLTFLAALGGLICEGRDYRDIFAVFGASEWHDRAPRIEERYGGFRADDLYPDVLETIGSLRRDGYRIAVVANQPAARTAQLRAIGVDPDVMMMSEELGAAKPRPEFFSAALRLMGNPPARNVAHVGDRVDNDVVPAAAAGMRPVRVRRGPWGYVQRDVDGVAVLTVASLTELARRIGEAWPD